ncbi:MAG: nuclear transport factor 2 family protein [Prolixibacteraceae bacterium]|nr:nuclear transport factor 2 family protein [Prolixibacteraceae bacterium]
MKKLFFFVLIPFVIFSCHHDEQKEKEAVLKVLQEEGDEFAVNNLEKVLALHIQDETATRIEGITIYSGWDDIKALYEKYITRNMADTVFINPRNIKENCIVNVNGNSAWVVCDNTWKWEIEGQPRESKNKQIAVLKKDNGNWKFALNAFVEYQRPEIIGNWNMVEVKNVNDGVISSSSPNDFDGKQIKIWTNSHFSFSGDYVLDGVKMDYYGGGTYTLNGNNYTENIDYHARKSIVGTSIKMQLEIKGDTLIQTYPVDDNGYIDQNNYSVEKYVRLD